MLALVLLAGLLIGRLWFVAVAALGWAVLVNVEETCTGWCLPGAAAIAGANAAVGVAAHKAIAFVVRAARARR